MRKPYTIVVAAIACLVLAMGAVAVSQEAGATSGTTTPAARPETSSSQGGYSYVPGGRRDPFVSLLIGRSLTGKARKPGLAGMQISEVDLLGIAKDSQGYIAMLSGSDTKVYNVRVGAELADGKVINITQRAVTFRQEIKDPFSTKPFRDIEKSLTPGEGEQEGNR